MAPVHRIKCERCGRLIRGGIHYVAMNYGISAMVCTDCRNMIESIFRAGRRAGLPDPEKLFPALAELGGLPHG